MEEILKWELGTSQLKNLGASRGGYINEGLTFKTDQGNIFVKVNHQSEAHQMFSGEKISLEAIQAMNIVSCPKPIKVMALPDGGAMLAMEWLDLNQRLSHHAARLGEEVARLLNFGGNRRLFSETKLHLANETIGKKNQKEEGFIHSKPDVQYMDRFGFDVTTYCGYIPQDNTWQDNWITLFAKKMEIQINLLEKEHGDCEARGLWSQLLPKLPVFFEGLDIKPALLHGDLWGGNIAENKDGPVIFDPASFYGHSEFDLAMSCMFGGFSSEFFDAYFKVIPKVKGYRERLQLYTLFNYINHWNHFGGGYKGSSISTFKSLIKYANSS